MGAGDLGFGLRAACVVSDRDSHGPCFESPRGFRARSSRGMDFVRGNHCDSIRSRAARSVTRDPSVWWSSEKLGEHHWRAGACVTDESGLVEVVRGPLLDHAHFDLDCHENAGKRRGPATVGGLGARPTNLRASGCHVFPHHLAGALGVFFCFDFCGRASGVARSDQVKCRGLDCVRVVDVSDFARLG